MAHIIISISKVAESYPSTQKVGTRERGEDRTSKEKLESRDQSIIGSVGITTGSLFERA